MFVDYIKKLRARQFKPGGDRHKQKDIKRRIKAFLNNLFRMFFLLSLSYIILFPLMYMISNALKPASQLFDPSIVWIPKSITFDNIITVSKAMNIWKSLWISLSVGIISAFVEVMTCAVIAYGFARYRFKESKFVFALVILTIVVPPQAVAIPLYLNFSQMDFLGLLNFIGKSVGTELRPRLLDTPLTFYLPSLFGVGVKSGLFIFIYRQFFKGLPKELEEAAWIDGTGPVKTFMKIVVPSSGVAFLTVMLFSVIWHWNEFHLSVLFFNESFPMSVSLAQIRNGIRMTTGYNEYYSPVYIRNLLMSGCLVFIAPMLIFYIFIQKYFIRSIERVGIVG